MNQQSDILQKIANAPEEPGVYLMKDTDDNIIYIGKAASIKKRVSSYFRETGHDAKTGIMVKHIRDIEFVITDSEVEALILESTLIKEHKPKYNVRLKDDKRYPYIAVTLSEAYPRVIITRRLIKNNNRYFGPYTDAGAARSIVASINAIFKLRLCKKDLPLKSSERPCLNYQMKKCAGICGNTISKEEYADIVNNAVSFLEGKIEPVMNELSSLMRRYSESREYEKAAEIRDIINNIDRISGTQKVYTPIGKDKDYIGIQINGDEAVIILFEFRNGVLLGRKISVFGNTKYADSGEIIKSFIMDYYKYMPPPSRIITQNNIKDIDLVLEYLSGKTSRKVSITLPREKEDTGIMNMIKKNLDMIAAERKAEQTSRDKKAGLLELKNILSLTALPEVIECFDISNLQGKNAVASMVAFKNGAPDKSNYRRYKIKAYDSANDPAMIHEAVARRLQYLLNEELPLPHLIVIDGGKGQLNRALEVKHALEADVAIIAIAKRLEEIFRENSNEPIRLDASSPGLRIIQSIRDEAHRFAVEYHKKLRGKEIEKSVVDDIPNIGEKKKKILLLHLGSAEKVKSALLEELTALPGIGPKTARVIYEFLHEKE